MLFYIYVWWLAGRLVTLHTRYFLFICPQCVTSTFKPVNNQLRQKSINTAWHQKKVKNTKSNHVKCKNQINITFVGGKLLNELLIKPRGLLAWGHPFIRTNKFLTFYFFSETNPLWVCESLWLFIDVANVQNFTHELNYRLSFVEGRGRH